MKRIFTFLLVSFIVSAVNSAFAQGADPEKVFKYSDKEEKLDEYLKERKWKQIDKRTNEEGEDYMLYRAKSYGGGFLYLAIYPGKFVHYQKFNTEKRDYSPVLTYEDFVMTPEGKTNEDYSITNEDELIKNITWTDHENPENENTFYGTVPKPSGEASVE